MMLDMKPDEIAAELSKPFNDENYGLGATGLGAVRSAEQMRSRQRQQVFKLVTDEWTLTADMQKQLVNMSHGMVHALLTEMEAEGVVEKRHLNGKVYNPYEWRLM